MSETTFSYYSKRKQTYLLMHSTISMKIRKSKANVMPMWWNLACWISWIRVHTDVIQGVWSSQPIERKTQNENNETKQMITQTKLVYIIHHEACLHFLQSSKIDFV